MDNNRFHYLLEEYILGRLDKEKVAELLRLLDEQAGAQQLEALIHQQLEEKVYDQEVDLPLTRQRIMAGLEAAVKADKETDKAPLRRMGILRRFRWAAAAVFLLLAGVAGWLMFNDRAVKPTGTGNIAAAQDID